MSTCASERQSTSTVRKAGAHTRCESQSRDTSGAIAVNACWADVNIKQG